MPVRVRSSAALSAPPFTVTKPPVLMESTVSAKRVASRVTTCAAVVPEKRKVLSVVVVKAPVELTLKSVMTERIPVPLAVELVFLKATGVVAVPDPTSKIPLFWKVPLKSLSPELEPMAPVDVTAPVKVRVPEVEVTTFPSCMTVAPDTVRAFVAKLIPLPPTPNMSTLFATVMPPPEKVAVPGDLVELTFAGNKVAPRVTV